MRTVENYLAQFEEELKRNGYEVLKDKRLKALKLALQAQNVPETGFGNITKSPQLGIFDFRAFLNLAMLMNEVFQGLPVAPFEQVWVADELVEFNVGTPRNKAEWQRLIDEQAACGLAQKAFCEQADIPIATFGYWKRKLKRTDRSPPLNQVGSIAVWNERLPGGDR